MSGATGWKSLAHGRGCLPWRWQVPTTIPRGAVQVWVNVSNHIRSQQPWMMHFLSRARLEGPFSQLFGWKTKLRLIRLKLMVGAASAEDSKSLPPSLEQQYRCESMCQITSGAAGWKMKVGQSARNSQGTYPIVGTTSNEDGKYLPPSLKEQYRCE